ncbi:cupin domain-containing protein [Jiangella aurantiaca]|uniref:Cupin domain-containing protein n=1 Tax=Jiangella aurantiaca TaxID=2530373 RepID=A0A4R5AE86_9ACTN|nr:cupin domain-containing protein [Jiangella aurantiaca]TDD70661.1 cupin domain-containing protein [Jiangella aurantiaca]
MPTQASHMGLQEAVALSALSGHQAHFCSMPSAPPEAGAHPDHGARRQFDKGDSMRRAILGVAAIAVLALAGCGDASTTQPQTAPAAAAQERAASAAEQDAYVAFLTARAGQKAGGHGGAHEVQPSIDVVMLTPRSEFTDDVTGQFKVKLDGTATNVLKMPDPSRTAAAQITVQPGARFPWHTHPGPVIVNVIEGELTYVQGTDCVERPYPSGTAFVDPGNGTVHTAFNSASEGVTVVVATFFDVPAEGPLTITEGVAAPADCEVEAGAHGSH